MSAEILIQIVNRQDQPTSTSTITNAQIKGLIHRVVRIMVENPKGEILLQKRSPEMINYPNAWDNSAAGHVDAGEEYLTAAKRELMEELGVEGIELKEVDTYYTDVKAGRATLKRFNRLYKAKIDFTPDKLQPEEVTEVKWITVDGAKELVEKKPDLVTDGLVDVLKLYY